MEKKGTWGTSGKRDLKGLFPDDLMGNEKGRGETQVVWRSEKTCRKKPRARFPRKNHIR